MEDIISNFSLPDLTEMLPSVECCRAGGFGIIRDVKTCRRSKIPEIAPALTGVLAAFSFAGGLVALAADAAVSGSVCRRFEIGANANPTVVHIQRAMKAMEDSSSNNPSTVRVLFYGQSIVAQGWTDVLMRMLKAKYPTVRFIAENRAIGGFEAPRLCRTAWSDIYPFYPDLLFFRCNGSIEKYEEIIRTVRSVTTAEIVLWSSHLRAGQDPAQSIAERDARSIAIRDVAERNGCMFVDLNLKWSRMLVEEGRTAASLLKDKVHLSEKSPAFEYYAGFIGEDLRRIPSCDGETNICGTVLDIPFERSQSVCVSKNGSVVLRFIGNRVVAVFGAIASVGDTARNQFAADVLLDGVPAANYREMWYATRPSALVSWMPMIFRVASKSVPVAEKWTLTYLNGTDQYGNPVHYRVDGSITGYDGEGWSNEDFTSNSGRVAISKEDCHFAWQYDYFMKRSKKGRSRSRLACPGQKVEWETKPLFASPLTQGLKGDMAVVVQNCAIGSHVLELRPPSGKSVPRIERFIVHCPVQGHNDKWD